MPLINNNHISIHKGPLFKYKSLDGANFDHTLEILRDSRIYCPTPTQLNDKLECKPDIIIGDLNDPQYRRNVEGWARRCIAHRDEQPTEEQIQAELAQLTSERLRELADATAGPYHEAIDRQYRILSMAKSPVNSHLWSEYAADYTGVCIQFDVRHLVTAYNVKYSDEVPLLDLTDNNGFASLNMTALRKRKKWEPEGEARIILREPPYYDQPPLINQKLNFGLKALRAVMFGYRAADEKKRALIDAIRGRNVPLYIAGGSPFKGVGLRPVGRS